MIKVIIVDDSAIVRQKLRDGLAAAPDIDVVGEACDPYVARKRIVDVRPDVVVLDLEMPRMDGLTFLAKLMRHHPMPVVVLSSAVGEGSDAGVKALSLGAVEVHSKPTSSRSVPRSLEALTRAIRRASATQPRPRVAGTDPRRGGSRAVVARLPQLKTTQRLIAIGSSTGGAQALEEVLRVFPADAPAVLLVQHIAEEFNGALAKRLNAATSISVREAKDGSLVTQGVALLAPAGIHMEVVRDGAQYVVRLSEGPRVNFHRPSVDVLFSSLAACAGSDAVGAILTGMGKDGAVGLKAMRDAGARTLAQDEASSVVYGMPGEAMRIGAAEESVSLEAIGARLLEVASTAPVQPRA